MPDIYYDDVVLLLARDAADASTSFTDDSITEHVITRNGDTQHDTAQKKHGSSSILFDGTGDYLSIPDHSDFAFGADDFTIEFWVRFNALPVAPNFASFIGQMSSNGSNFAFHVLYDPASNSGWGCQVSTAGGASQWACWGQKAGQSAAAINTWYHVAMVRQGTNVTMYVDGAKLSLQANYNYGTNSVFNSTDSVLIGASKYTGGVVYPFNGWMDDLRITKGVARYTTETFTPPGDIWMEQFGLFDTVGASEVMLGSDTVGNLTDAADSGENIDGVNVGERSISESASAADSLTQEVIQWFYESVTAHDAASVNTSTTTTVIESVLATDVIAALFQELVSESASGSETWYLDTAVKIIEVVRASDVSIPASNITQAISEVVVALELATAGRLEDIVESASATEVVSQLLSATQQIIEAGVAADTNSFYIVATNSIADVAAASESVTPWQNLTVAITESAEAFIHLDIGGEVYSGWVLNTQRLAASEYQGLAFNSMARIGNRYFGADKTGIHEFAGTTDNGVAIHAMLQTGLMDFGETHKKAMYTAYLAVDASGRMALGVYTSSQDRTTENWYEVMVDTDAPNNVRIPVGRGLQARYWKFAVASERMETFEAMSLLPIRLTRRI